MIRWRSRLWLVPIVAGCSLTNSLDDLSGATASNSAGDTGAGAMGATGGTHATGGQAGADVALGGVGAAGDGAAGMEEAGGDGLAVDVVADTSVGTPCVLPLKDDFGDGTIGDWWSQWVDTGLSVAEKNGRLELAASASVATGLWAGVESKQAYDATGCAAVLHVLNVPNQDAVFLSFGLKKGPSEGFHLVWDKGSLLAELQTGGAYVTLKEVPFSATAHAWWRLSEAGGTFHFDVSPNGTQWNELGSVQAPFSVSSVVAFVGIGTKVSPTELVATTVDDFDFPPP